LNFHSNVYQWLVVTGGDTAKFKGTGTINGAGVFNFQIWAFDGDKTNTFDTFRLRIWEEVAGVETDVYDNGSAQAIGGGKIQVHVPKKVRTRRLGEH
jgi:hypothetical protein